MENARGQEQKPVTGYPAAKPSYPTGPKATAYPYPAPPSAPYYPNAYHAHIPTYDPRRATLLLRLFVATIAVFITVGAVIFIVRIVLHPDRPEFSVSSVAVSPLNVSSSSSQISADWDISLSISNPNKKLSVSYQSVQASIVYGNDVLAQVMLRPFYQVKGNLTTIRATFAALASYVEEGTVKDLNTDTARGKVQFHVRLFSWVRFRNGALRTSSHLMRVWCRDVSVGFPNATAPGSLLGPPTKCDVYM